MYIYICGRGYSGSTALDIMLGNAREIESVGELVAGMGRYEDLCSCGETFESCDYWKAVRERFLQHSGVDWKVNAKISARQAHINCFLKTYLSAPSSAWSSKLTTLNESTLKAIKSDHSQYVVDSSKEVTRACFLLRNLPQTKVIHLVKNPVTVLESTYYRLASGSGFRFLRRQYKPKKVYAPALLLASLGWLVGNVLAEFVLRNAGDRKLRVRYEDLVEAPIDVMNTIEHRFSVDLSKVRQILAEGGEFNIGHNIGGNHLRHNNSFVFDPGKGSRGGLPEKYRKMVTVICYPLMKKYGYIGKTS